MSVRHSEPSITVRERVVGAMSLAGRRRWYPVEGHRPPQAFRNRLSRAVGVYVARVRSEAMAEAVARPRR